VLYNVSVGVAGLLPTPIMIAGAIAKLVLATRKAI
jgi:hypothetical protein